MDNDILETYTFDEAAKLLKSSVHQLGRLVRKGYLEQVGGRLRGGGRRQITKRSIISFQQNRGAIWHHGSDSAASVATVQLVGTPAGGNSGRGRKTNSATSGLVTFPPVRPLKLGDEHS